MTHKEPGHTDIVAMLDEQKQVNKENRVLREAGRILVKRKESNPATETVSFNKDVELVISAEFRYREQT